MLQFLIIILVGAGIGYYLGQSKYGDSIQDTIDRSRTTVSNSWQKRFGKSQSPGDEAIEPDKPAGSEGE